MASKEFEPTNRDNHAAVGIGSKLYVWGGTSTNILEVFDVLSLTWEQPLALNGSVMPQNLQHMAVTSDGKTAYSFGGTSDYFTKNNYLFQITPSQQLCEALPPASSSHMVPEKTSSSCIVQFKDKLVLHGGCTGHKGINELLVFDLKNRVWAVQHTTGDRPPPLESHTFTKIDHHRAVVFGGSTGAGNRINDTYVLDMETWHWTKLKITGKKPSARHDHATCCIAGPFTGQQHPLLMVTGGHGGTWKGTLRDVWLLDVDKGVWSKVTLPVAIIPRCGHSATLFGNGSSFRALVLFGGYNGAYLKDTTLLLLEFKGGSWQVARVVKSNELRSGDESLREEMKKLDFSPQKELQPQSLATDGAVSSASPKDISSSTHTATTIDLSDLHIGDQRLGKGGFGDVYEGKWKENRGKVVAIKVVRSSATGILLREIQVWSSLPSHANIVTFFGVAYEKFNTFIVSELAVNGSLFDYLHTKKNTPSVNQSLAWASDVAHGMKHLHDHDIIHRDLKSANVLLTSEWVAKLCDFGTARELTHTTTTDHAGTYRWMSPEIMRAAEARINKKCDLFSYGMVLFELFAHKKPYADTDGDPEVAIKVLGGERPPIPPTLPPYLHDLLRGCWEEDPHLRPTFDDFVDKIKRK